jgi:hypothetical protein
MTLITRVARFARSPQGRRLAREVSRYARSPEGKRRIEQARRQVVSRRTPPR